MVAKFKMKGILFAIIFSFCLAFSACDYKDIYQTIQNKELYKNAKEANKKGKNLVVNEPKESLKYLEKALRCAQEYDEQCGDVDSKISETLLSDIYNNLSLAYYLLEEYETSITYADLAIDTPPIKSVEYSNRGNALCSLGRYEEAMDDYEKAVELDETNSYAYYGKGLVYCRWNDYNKAIESFDHCLLLNKNDIDYIKVLSGVTIILTTMMKYWNYLIKL